jgi:hypothetical protein
MWDSPHGREVYKHRRRLINGILQKHLGKPWNAVWKELQAKVHGLQGETTKDLINWYVEYETWLENGVVMKQGMWGPEPVRASRYGTRMAYYVDPTDYTLKALKAYSYKKDYTLPEELPCKAADAKYVRNGNTWFQVSFTPEQLKLIKTGKVLDASRKREDYDKRANSGDEVARCYSKKVEVAHFTNHRGFPPRWQWRYCLQDWKQMLEDNLGKTHDEVLHAATTLPRIHHYGLTKEAIQIEQLLLIWVGNGGKKDNWTPYIWKNGCLAVNPQPDNFKETMKLRPTVRAVNSKELDQIRTQVEEIKSHEDTE